MSQAAIAEPRSRHLRRWSLAATLAVALHVTGAALALMLGPDEDLSEETAGAMTVELAALPAAPPRDNPDVAHGPLMEEAEPAPQASKRAVEKVEQETPVVDQAPRAPDPKIVVPVPRPVEEKKPEEEENQEEIAVQPKPVPAVAAPMTAAPPPLEAKPALTAAAPARGTALVPSHVQISWHRAILSHLNRHKRYPESARARGLQGVVDVEFVLDPSGLVLSSRVVKSSGSAQLDEEALGVLARASPLPAPPDQAAGVNHQLVLPIQFTIK